MTDNRDVTRDELARIRRLDDFDLTMLISEIHDRGWRVARQTLAMIPVTISALDLLDANPALAAKADPIGQLMMDEGIGFLEAVERLAREAGKYP